MIPSFRDRQDPLVTDLVAMRDALRSGPTFHSVSCRNGATIRSSDEIAELLHRAVLALSDHR